MKTVLQFSKRGFLILLLITFIPVFCLAGEKGFLIIKDYETYFEPDSTPFTSQNKIWITGKNVRIENDQDNDRLLLINMDKNEIYQVDNKAKTYKRLEIPEGLKDIQRPKEIESKRLQETKKFGDWDCYKVSISTKANDIYLDAEYWLTKDVDIPYSWRRKVAKYFGLDQENLTEELAKYEGYPVYVVLKMKSKEKEIKVCTMVMELKELEIDSKTFEIPHDFNLVDMSFKPEDKKTKDPNINIGQEKSDVTTNKKDE